MLLLTDYLLPAEKSCLYMMTFASAMLSIISQFPHFTIFYWE